ncbi:hypothetical protein [Lysinibacillus yapensis]|uniref:hypothetical protein n=1 Tax=Ureibacillus yapensis TaxID=2304605 RepID=UPI00131458CE|nr:hypothetical protein [Lysinibacillus yapensis]
MGDPKNYEHIAVHPERRVNLVFTDKEVETFNHIKAKAEFSDEPIEVYIKKLLEVVIKE